MKSRRNTVQRTLIQSVAETLYHPSADEVYSAVKEKERGVGRATVFRNLNLLSDEGIFLKVCFQGEPTRYDTNPAPHDHFVCRVCGKIVDLPPTGKGENVNNQADFPSGITVESKSVTYYGLCDKCAARSKKEEQ